MRWPWSEDEPLVPYADALAALGNQGSMRTVTDEVALDSIVGSVSRPDEFDRSFRPRQRTPRFEQVLARFRRGDLPPPVDLLRLGELYFVSDGHHRVAAAKQLGWDQLPATVRQVCTVAFAWGAMRVADLAAADAKRRFLEEVPLPDDVATDLWLDVPADWDRIADVAMAWGYRRQRDTEQTLLDSHALASAWWQEAVEPALARVRRGDEVSGRREDGLSPGDLQLVVTALAGRDDVASQVRGMTWPEAPCACHEAPTSSP